MTALARGLLRQPSVLILDEATSTLEDIDTGLQEHSHVSLRLNMSCRSRPLQRISQIIWRGLRHLPSHSFFSSTVGVFSACYASIVA
jgi:ABC-type bacteriocin/lantibiotic exporter with double-glycine peptidase domain